MEKNMGNEMEAGLILENYMDDQPYYGPHIDLKNAKHIGNYIGLHITLVPSLIIQGFQMVKGSGD